MSSDQRHLESDEVEAWEGLLYVYVSVMRELESRFPREAGLSLRDFDVLATVAESPGRSLRMSDLARNVILSPSRLTRLVQKVEERGLVSREPDATDGRAVTVRLTSEGRLRHRAATRIHDEVIRARFLGRIDDGELEHLGALWRQVLEGSRYARLLDEHVEAARRRQEPT